MPLQVTDIPWGLLEGWNEVQMDFDYDLFNRPGCLMHLQHGHVCILGEEHREVSDMKVERKPGVGWYLKKFSIGFRVVGRLGREEVR